MYSLQIVLPAPEVFCFPLTGPPFPKILFVDLQNIFFMTSALFVSSVPQQIWAWIFPFLLSFIICVCQGILLSFSFVFPLSHLDDLIFETSIHKCMAFLELLGNTCTASKALRGSRVKGKASHGTSGTENNVLMAARTELALQRGKSY